MCESVFVIKVDVFHDGRVEWIHIQDKIPLSSFA